MLLFGSPGAELAIGFESIDFGITAIAGDMDWGTFGEDESVEGIEQRFFNGFPHRSILPEKDFVFCLNKDRDSGIAPVKLLNERSMVEF